MTDVRLNDTQMFLLDQICEILFDSDANIFVKDGCVNYIKIKSSLYARYPNDAHLKVWDLVSKHFSDKKIILNETKKLSLPLAFKGVVCYHQKEFK